MNNKEITLNDKLEIIHSYGVNLETSTVYIAGEIDGAANISLRMKIDMIKEYCRHITKPLTELNLVISSPGGDATAITAMMDLYDSLLREGIKTNILTEGICYSAATFFVACAPGVRTAGRRARFLVHELQIRGVEGTHTQTKAFQKELTILNDDMLEVYTECTLKKRGAYLDGKTPSDKEFEKVYKDWEKKCQNETYLSAEQAQELGLIDEIV